MGCASGGLGWLELVGVVAGVFAVGWLVRFFALFQQLLRATYHAITYEPIESEAVPDHLPPLYRSYVAQLAQLGFVPQGYLRVRRLAGFPDPYYSTPALLRHRDLGVYALVDVAPTPDKWQPVHVAFWTFLDDERAIATFNGIRAMMLPELPNTQLIDPYAATLAEQWHAHLQALRAAGEQRARQLEPEELVAAVQARESAYVDDLVAHGRLRPRVEGEGYEMPVVTAVGLSVQAVRGQRRLRRMYGQMARAEQAPPTLPIEEEVALFGRLERLRRMPGRRRVYQGLFALTALLFTASMALLFDAAMVLLLGLVVLFHELGHYAAMRAFGYADTTIFFLPFLGAATTGRRDGAPVGQELVIFLAGPVPGLVLAFGIGALYSASPGSWQQQGLLVLVIVNLFNLLPVFPLDGGRVLHLLIFRRHRWLEAAFMTAAGLVLFGVGLRLESALLALIGVAVGFTVPHRLRLAHLLGLLRSAQRVADTEPEASDGGTRRVFRLMDANGYRGGTLARRFMMARGLLQRQAERTAGAGALIAGLLAYVAALVGGLLLLVQVALPRAGGGLANEVDGPARRQGVTPPAGVAAVPCGEPVTPASAPTGDKRRFGMNLYVDCALPSEALAEATVSKLKNFFAAVPRFTDLRPPWVETDLAPAALRRHERARETYRRLQRISQRAIVKVDPGTFYRRIAGCDRPSDPEQVHTQAQARARAIRARRAVAVREYLKRPEASDLDAHTAQLYLQVVGAKPDQQDLQALAARMGRLDPDKARQSPTALGEAYRERNKLVLPYLWLPDATSRAQLTHYLCKTGCTNLRMGEL